MSNSGKMKMSYDSYEIFRPIHHFAPFDFPYEFATGGHSRIGIGSTSSHIGLRDSHQNMAIEHRENEENEENEVLHQDKMGFSP